MPALRFPSKQFRSLPSPTGTSRIGVFYCPAANVPRELIDWRDVNPREVKRGTKVYTAIAKTLRDEPERFHERNRGIALVAESLSYDDKRHEVILDLSDRELHGVVDGAHTLDAILEAQVEARDGEWPAHVFVKAITDVEPDQIAEIAGGLNTSQQVDLRSLENLRGHFDQLQKAIAGQPYAKQIAYWMNDDKPVDVREILYYLAVFDCTKYDDKKHPVALFGRKEGIVAEFSKQAATPSSDDSFRALITMAPDILRLRDLIEKRTLELDVGRFNSGKAARVRSRQHAKNRLIFLDESARGKISLGWIMPMLGAFRANVEWNKPKGGFSWIIPVEELLDSCIEQLVLGIKEIHTRENARPEYVGRNATAWRMSYNVVAQAILERQLASARKKHS